MTSTKQTTQEKRMASLIKETIQNGRIKFVELMEVNGAEQENELTDTPMPRAEQNEKKSNNGLKRKATMGGNEAKRKRSELQMKGIIAVVKSDEEYDDEECETKNTGPIEDDLNKFIAAKQGVKHAKEDAKVRKVIPKRKAETCINKGSKKVKCDEDGAKQGVEGSAEHDVTELKNQIKKVKQWKEEAEGAKQGVGYKTERGRTTYTVEEEVTTVKLPKIDKYSRHVANEDYYVKELGDRVGVTVFNRKTRERTEIHVGDCDCITDLRICKNALLVSTGDVTDTGVKNNKVTLHYLGDKRRPEKLWEYYRHREFPQIPKAIGFYNGIYICLEDRLAYVNRRHAECNIQFGDEKAGEDVLVAYDPDASLLTVLNLRKGNDYVMRKYTCGDDGDLEFQEDKQQECRYSCVDKYGRIAMDAAPYSDKYFIYDLKQNFKTKCFSYSPSTSIAEHPDGYVITNDMGQVWQISKQGKMARIKSHGKSLSNVAVCDGTNSITCMKLCEDGLKVSNWTLFPKENCGRVHRDEQLPWFLVEQ